LYSLIYVVFPKFFQNKYKKSIPNYVKDINKHFENKQQDDKPSSESNKNEPIDNKTLNNSNNKNKNPIQEAINERNDEIVITNTNKESNFNTNNVEKDTNPLLKEFINDLKTITNKSGKNNPS
jgi:hypothetical protein